MIQVYGFFLIPATSLHFSIEITDEDKTRALQLLEDENIKSNLLKNNNKDLTKKNLKAILNEGRKKTITQLEEGNKKEIYQKIQALVEEKIKLLSRESVKEIPAQQQQNELAAKYEALVFYLMERAGRKKFKDKEFSIGREVKTRETDNQKFDDTVFKYEENGKSYIIPIQVKHKGAKDPTINSHALKKCVGEFSIPTYFLAYLDLKEDIEKIPKNPSDKQKYFQGTEIEHLVIFTSASLHGSLEEEGFTFKNAPSDIINIFSLSRKNQQETNYQQLEEVSGELKERLTLLLKLKKICSDKNTKERLLASLGRQELQQLIQLAKKGEASKKKEAIHETQEQRSSEQTEKQLSEQLSQKDAIALSGAILQRIATLESTVKSAKKSALKNILESVAKSAEPKDVEAARNELEKYLEPTKKQNIEDEKGEIKNFLDKLVFIVNQPKAKDLESLVRDEMLQDMFKDFPLRGILDEHTLDLLRKSDV
jgi:hypothetical protein